MSSCFEIDALKAHRFVFVRTNASITKLCDHLMRNEKSVHCVV